MPLFTRGRWGSSICFSVPVFLFAVVVLAIVVLLFFEYVFIYIFLPLDVLLY